MPIILLYYYIIILLYYLSEKKRKEEEKYSRISLSKKFKFENQSRNYKYNCGYYMKDIKVNIFTNPISPSFHSILFKRRK